MQKIRYVNLSKFLFKFVNSSKLKVLLAISIFLSLIDICVIIKIPFINSDVINALVNSEWNVFKSAVMLLIIFFAIRVINSFIVKYILLLFTVQFENNFRKTVFKYIVNQNYNFSEKFHTGDIMSRIINDAPRLNNFIAGIFFQLIFDFIAIFVALYILSTRNLLLTLIIVLFAPLAIIAGKFFKKKINLTTAEVQGKISLLTSKIQTWVSRFNGIKNYAIEPIAINQLNNESNVYSNSAVKAGLWNSLMNTVNVLILSFPTILILIVGGHLYMKHQITIGEIFAFSAFSSFFIVPLQRIAAIINIELPKIYPIYDRFCDLGFNNYKNKATIKQDVSPFDKVKQLNIKGLEYFNEKANFSLKIEKMTLNIDDIAGVEGTNGSGKTTIAKLLKGLLTADKGNISLTNENITSKETISGNVFFMSQDRFYFDGNLIENITLFESLPDKKRYDNIIKNMGISGLSDKLNNSKKSDNSRLLSGGELQKINIARLLYAKNSILILDEPDNYLDADIKKVLIENLLHIKSGRIIILITHDKDFLAVCNKRFSINLNTNEIKEAELNEC